MLDFLNHLFNFNYFNIIYRKFIKKQSLLQKIECVEIITFTELKNRRQLSF